MAVRTQAESRQSLIDSLDDIGVSREDYETSNVLSAGENDVAAFIERVRANIDSSGMVLSGNIAEMSIEVFPEGIQILGNEYLLYQDRGVKGSKSAALAPNSPHKYTDKMPPLDVFIDYVKKKNLLALNQAQFFEGESPFSETTEEDKIKTIAVLLQKKVFDNGFKPRNIFAKEIPQLKEDLKVSIKDFAKQSIREVFKFNR